MQGHVSAPLSARNPGGVSGFDRHVWSLMLSQEGSRPQQACHLIHLAFAAMGTPCSAADKCHRLLSTALPLRKGGLALTLLMLGVFADNHDAALALDDLALFANGLDRGSHFHSEFPPCCSVG